jgi:hypothetical protein
VELKIDHDRLKRLQITMIERYGRQIVLVTLIVLALLGVFLRVYQYAFNRSLWVDEAMLALNIVDRSFAGLTRPLDYDQVAPIGFLLVQKATVQVLGNSDLNLRLFPLAAGVLSIFLMARVSRGYLLGAGVPIALALFALSRELVYYSSDLKQYSADVLIALLLLFIAYESLHQVEKRRTYVLLAVAGVFALWFSYPALFIILGIAFGLGASELSKRDWRRAVPLGLVLLGFLASFALLYLFSLRFLTSDPSLVDFWRNSFMPMPPWRNWAWLWNAFSDLIRYALALPTGTTISFVVALAVLLLGVISLFVRKWAMALFVVVPLPAVLAASAVEKYPFGGRLLLFALPILFLLMAEGVERSRTILRKLNPWLALAICGLLAIALLYYPALRARHRLLHPTVGENVKAVMSYVRDGRLATDSIYVYYGAAPSFEYYAPFYDLQGSRTLVGAAHREEPDQYLAEISAFQGSPRVWFFFSHNCWGCMVDEEAYFVEHLDAMGSRIDEFRSTGAAVYLYDLAARGQ